MTIFGFISLLFSGPGTEVPGHSDSFAMRGTRHIVAGLILAIMLFVNAASAQQPSPSPTPQKSDDNAPVDAGENAGNYLIISSIEAGYRGIRVVGDQNKYESDLNY